MNRSIAWLSCTSLLLAALAGCGKKESGSATSADASSPDLDGMVLVDTGKSLEFTLDDGELTIHNWKLDKSTTGTYAVDEAGNLNIWFKGMEGSEGLPFQKTESGWQNRLHGFVLREKRDADEDLQDADRKGTQSADAVRGAARPPLSDYTNIELADLRYVYAAHMGEVEDEDLARVFIPGYADEPDAFRKREMFEAGIGAIKARIAGFADKRDYKVLIDSVGDAYEGFTNVTLEPYDFKSQGFGFGSDVGPCSHKSMGLGQLNVRGQRFLLKAWGQSGTAPCMVEVQDEAVARALETLRATYDLRSRTTLYFRVPGDFSQSNVLNLEAHRIELDFFDAPVRGEPNHVGGPFVVESH